MKKFLKVIGIVISLIFVAIVVIPFVVDVDQYRPQIVKAANDNMNGKLELGKLKLSLWGQIRIEIAGVKLTDAQGRSVVNVKDAYFHVPFSSLLGGAPLLTFSMSSPELNVLKDKAGNLNVMSIAKLDKVKAAESQPGSPAGTTPTKNESPSAKAAQKSDLPAMARNARLGVRIEKAKLIYKDDMSGVQSQIDDLNLVIKDLSLSRPTEIELWAQLATQTSTGLHLDGPIKFTAKSELVGGSLDHINLSANLNLDDLEIHMPGVFKKSKGVDAHMLMELSSTPDIAKIQKLSLKFFNAEIQASGGAENLKGASKTIHFTAQSGKISLKEWKELLPALQDGELAGQASFEAKADGPQDKLQYSAKLAIENLTAKTPGLKAQPQFDLLISVITDQVDKILFTMKAPGNDLKVSGKLVSFTQPKFDLSITSTGMDLDQLIVFPPPAKPAAAPAAKAESSQGATPEATKQADKGKVAPSADFDAMLDPLRKNTMAQAASALILTDIRFIKAQGVKLSDLTAKMTFKDLAVGLDSFSTKLWDGTIKMSARAALKPKTPTYELKTDLSGLMLQQAVTSNFELLKNTVTGKAFFKLDATGSSFNPDPATKNLRAKGTMKIEKAKFASIDIGKMTSDAINSGLGKVGDKIPQAKGKKVNLPERESKYDVISSDFTIADGVFSAPNFVAKAAPNDGIDLSGNTKLGLIDFKLDAKWLVIDTYNFTKARDIGVDQNGVKVDHILAEGNGPVKFPVTLGGTAFMPVFSYNEVPDYLIKVALGNVSGAAKGKLKAEAAKQLDQVSKQAPPQVQKALQGIGKKLFGK